jgi:hypothetical protein
MATELSTLAPGAIGALTGVLATALATRARVGVSIDRIGISPAAYATSAAVVVNRVLMARIDEIPLGEMAIHSVSVPESRYVSYLEDVVNAYADHITTFEYAIKVAEELRSLAVSESYDSLTQKYKQQQGMLWTWAEGHTRRGGSVYDTEQMEDLDIEHNTVYAGSPTESGGVWVVDLPGTINLVFAYKNVSNTSVMSALEALSLRTAKAFSRQRKTDLIKYFTVVKELMAANLETVKHVRREVVAERARFSRLEIEILVTNVGRTGMSIGPEAEAQIFLEGYRAPKDREGRTPTLRDIVVRLGVLTDKAVDERRAGVVVEDGLQRFYDAANGSPILIQPGQSLRLVCVSNDRLPDLGEWSAMQAAYSAAERLISVRIAQFRRPRWFHATKSPYKILRSRKVLFRDLRTAWLA